MGDKMLLYYEFCLDDYSAPSCTSGRKYYYGTKVDFLKMLDNIEKDKTIPEREVFKEFCNGNTKVENIAGFTKVRFAKRVTVLNAKKIDTNEKETYTYTNPYGFDYVLSMDLTISYVLLLKSGKKYIVAYQTLMKNPRYKDEFAKDGYADINMFLGFPGMIGCAQDKENYLLYNMLYMPEKTFENKEEAKQYFKELKRVDYKSFFEDIFADG